MKPEEALGLAIPVAFILFWGTEHLFNRLGGGAPFPKIKWWGWVGVISFVLAGALTTITPLLLPTAWLADHRLLDLTGLGLWGVPIGYVAISFILYWFHRLEHRSDILWRGMHQMHHSAERVDMAGWALSHPNELIVQTILTVVVSTFVLGLDPLAAALAGTVSTVLSMFVHWNVTTPRWIGTVFMRPEQHCLHHEYEVHARNYSNDLAIWDQLFGSYANIGRFEGKTGFNRSAVKDLPAMFVFADVNGQRSAQQ